MTHESVWEGALLLALVPGSVVAAAALTVVGVVRDDGRWFGAAGVLFGVVSVPLIFGLSWMITALGAFACFIAAYMGWPRQGQEPSAA